MRYMLTGMLDLQCLMRSVGHPFPVEPLLDGILLLLSYSILMSRSILCLMYEILLHHSRLNSLESFLIKLLLFFLAMTLAVAYGLG